MSEKEKMELEPTELETTETLAEETTEAAASSKPKAAKKDKAKPVEKKKQGNRLTRYLREMRSELKKVSWPTKKQTINNTGIVIVCVIVVGIFVWLFDAVAAELISALINLFGQLFS